MGSDTRIDSWRSSNVSFLFSSSLRLATASSINLEGSTYSHSPATCNVVSWLSSCFLAKSVKLMPPKSMSVSSKGGLSTPSLCSTFAGGTARPKMPSRVFKGSDDSLIPAAFPTDPFGMSDPKEEVE